MENKKKVSVVPWEVITHCTYVNFMNFLTGSYTQCYHGTRRTEVCCIFGVNRDVSYNYSVFMALISLNSAEYYV